MDIRATLASQIYSQAQVAARPAVREGAAPGAGEAFRAAAVDFMETLRAGEATVEAGLAGRADPQAVVEALAATELAVQTAVAVRDKVVEAYQEILRMPV
jgi:flagellar hook-basal body complex protein FliE